jgi:hypothetical protein
MTRVIPAGALPLASKIALAGEIVSSYLVIRLRMGREDLRELVRDSRRSPAESRAELEPGSAEEWLVAARLGNAVIRTLAILPTDARCLVQALVLSRLLSVRGISSTLVIGAHSKPNFAAHAWIEHEGRPVLPQEEFDESRLLEI